LGPQYKPCRVGIVLWDEVWMIGLDAWSVVVVGNR